MSRRAGWYPDTQIPGGERYWDGAQWTEQRRAAATDEDVPALLLAPHRWASDWGYIWAVLMPVVGLLIGIRKIRHQPRQAWQIIALSLGAGILWSILVGFGLPS